MCAYKPDSYNSVSVYIMAERAQQVIDFLNRTFAGVNLRRFEDGNGRIMHAEVRVGDTVVMVSDANKMFPAFPVWLHVYVPDVDATYKKALAAGGVSVQEPTRKEGDPDRRGGVKDPCGNTWWISTQQG